MEGFQQCRKLRDVIYGRPQVELFYNVKRPLKYRKSIWAIHLGKSFDIWFLKYSFSSQLSLSVFQPGFRGNQRFSQLFIGLLKMLKIVQFLH